MLNPSQLPSDPHFCLGCGEFRLLTANYCVHCAVVNVTHFIDSSKTLNNLTFNTQAELDAFIKSLDK